MIKNFGRKIKVDIAGATFTNEELEIRFEVPFDDDVKPNQSFVQIYNLSKSTIAKFKTASPMTIQAGYGTDVGLLASGKVSQVLSKWEGVDKITTVYMIEGEDFTKVKVTEKTADKDTISYHKEGTFKGQVIEGRLGIGFKPGTDALTIINRLVKVLEIKLGGPVILKKNVTYKKGYLATQLILNNLEEIVNDCGSVMYHRRGKLIIRPIDVGTDEKFLLEEDTGLIETPAEFEETNKRGTKDVTVKGYSVKCLMQHRITTASIITIKSNSANGKYRAFKGKHIADMDDFVTQFQVF